MSFKLNLKFQQGATYDKTVTWLDVLSVPINLTGCSARMQVRNKIADTTTLVNLSTDTGGIILGGTLGTVRILIPATVTSTYQWLNGVYDLEVQFSDNTVIRLLYGTVSVSLEVTR